METVYTVLMQEDYEPKRGIKFEATSGQSLSALFLIFLMLVLPIGGYEYLSGRLDNSPEEVYTAQTVNQQDTQSTQGRVAGISTAKQSTNTQLKDTFEFATQSHTLLIAGGISLVSFAIILSGSLAYDFMKKSD